MIKNRKKGGQNDNKENKTDLYVRIVLTVIAVCLVWIVIKPMAIQTAQAGRSETVNVNIQKVAGHRIYGQYLRVEIKP